MAILCTERNSVDIKDGTLSRCESPAPGVLGSLWARIESTAESAYSSISSAVSSAVQMSVKTASAAYHGAQHDLACAGCLAEAYIISRVLAPKAILEETGHELGEILKGLLPSIILMLVVLGATTALGAAIGGLIGAIFSAGTLAVPGAIAGGEVGFDIGMAALTWLGVGFLLWAMVVGLKEVFGLLKQGVMDGWGAGDLNGVDQKRAIEKSARELARMTGVFFRVLLQGIIAYLLKEAGIKATRSAAQTVSVIRSAGADAAAAGTKLRIAAAAEEAAKLRAAVQGLVKKLRESRWLGGSFADWVAADWMKIMENPKLEVETPATTEGAAGERQVGHTSNGSSGSATSVQAKPPGPEPAKLPVPRRPPGWLADQQLQSAADRIHKSLNDPVAEKMRTTTVTQGIDGQGKVVHTVTNSFKVTDEQAAEARSILGPDVVIDDAKPMRPAPQDRSNHGEIRGMDLTEGQTDRVQASSSRAGHGGAACDSCAPAQDAAGVRNATGVQEKAGGEGRTNGEYPKDDDN